ncbi:hypothetical protein ACN4EG_00225 [Alkalinema pantanalense CENA528]|uniref:hypothetical protein n=1 Tax=Alkalinema pantanalense TaxID=1620705 RepID=UPI003D6FB80A
MSEGYSSRGTVDVNHWVNHNFRSIGTEEQQLYDHLLQIVQLETPQELIDRMRLLFIEGTNYPDHNVLKNLDRLILSNIEIEEFQFILNRCIHILTNRWQGRPQTQAAIPDLIHLLESSPSRPTNEFSRAKAIKRLREFMRYFLETEQFLTLRRLAHVLESNNDPSQTRLPLGKLIRRYPYLYSHCLVSESSSVEDQQSIRDLQDTMQHQYELDLSQFVTYQIRRSHLFNQTGSDTVGRTLYPVKNPTLLTEPEVCSALRQFAGKVQGNCTHRDLAQRFLTHTHEAQSFKSFKDDLYEYLLPSVDPDYGRRQFNNQLYDCLNRVLPENHAQPFNEFLLLRTCSQLLNFLIVESPQQPKHFVFVDLLSNIGPVFTTSLLLKIVLICRKVKPYLEKRFSILFNHYEAYAQESVQWLVSSLEHLNIALSTNFGKMNVALVHQLA